MDEDDHRELQLLPSPRSSSSSLDLQLSISLGPFSIHPPHHQDCLHVPVKGSIRALKWQASEQVRMASIERAYAERLRDLTRREVELAQEEFARARHLWERTRAEAERAKRIRDRANHQVGSPCVEITCQSCGRQFQS
ncbi:hypothetical protein MLD38_012589 [Melastoma candidum]|uniref:Uncharacterized protein n=1 Tax=Melastoma candidum TaxID=119954 RepID=A0ACB9R6T3_9MYRT|nr:hypothetical protein MLD38_012589 [Melastoma candidum]